MQFKLQDNKLTFHDQDKSYIIPMEDVQRLVSRPGTRVLRVKTDDGFKSMPLATAISEIEGFGLLSNLHKSKPLI